VIVVIVGCVISLSNGQAALIVVVVVHLRTLIVVTDTEGTLATETVGPEATKLNLSLRDGVVGVQEPGTKDRLGENVEHGVSNDLSVNVDLAGTVGNTPDNWVDGPEDESETTNGGEEVSDLATLASSRVAATDSELPDDDKVGSTGHGVPAPLLRSALVTESGEKTGEDHDNVGNNGDKNVTTLEASDKSEIKKEKRSGHTPVNVTGPVDLTVNIAVGVWDVLVGLGDSGVVVRDTVTGCLESR